MKNRRPDISFPERPALNKEQLPALILNNLEDTFVLIDRDLRIIRTNEITKQKIAEYFQVTVSEGSGILEMVPPERHTALKKIYEQVFEGSFYKTETEVKLASETIYLANHFKPARDEDGNIIGVLVITRNITESKKADAEIKAANERFDIIMRATHDLVWDWNLQTNEIYRDPAGLKKVFGVADNETIKGIQAWQQRIHPDDQKIVRAIITEITNAQEANTFEIEYRFLRDDGRYSYVYDRGIIIRNEEGKPVRMIGAAQDISERKRLEQELLRNELERQKAINRATIDSQEQERTEIGKELHDNVNQVLTTTKLYLELALSNPELKDELITKSNLNIISVINEIRQLSRSLMDPTIGDLGLIDSIKDLIENINLTRKLHVSLKADKRIELFLDKNHKLTIFRIIQEALNNAMRHAQASSVFILIRCPGNKVEMNIEDNGIGFDPALVKRGAGLKNIQNRIYLINGTYTIQTAPEQGCRLSINFPITK
jgi:PAS domain S-box-containing protein